jgi:hypothetical protein
MLCYTRIACIVSYKMRLSNFRSETRCHGKATIGRSLQKGECLDPGRCGTAMLVLILFYAKCLRPFVTLSVQETKQQTNTSTGLCNTSGWRRQKNELKNCAVLRLCIATGLGTDIMNNSTLHKLS